MRTRCLLFLALAAGGCGKSETSPQVADAGAPETSSSHDAAPDLVVSPEATPDSSPEAMSDAPEAATSNKPVWKEISGEVAGCKLQRLVNPSDVRVYSWKPCDGIPGCEISEYSSAFASAKVNRSSQVGEMNGTLLIALGLSEPSAPIGEVILSDENGNALDGFRVDPKADSCASQYASLSVSQFGLSVHNDKPEQGKPSAGGVLATPGAAPVLFNMPVEAIGAPDRLVFGNGQWVWKWVLPSYLASVSSTDGSGFKFLYKGLEVQSVVTTGAHFLIARNIAVDGGLSEDILITDGIAAPQPYLTPPSGSSFGAVGYAHSHVVWLRGYNQQNLLYEKVELWASPYTTDPAALKPEKIGDWPETFIPTYDYSAGYGRFAAAIRTSETTRSQIIWDVTTKQQRSIPLPPDRYIGGAPGMTKTHVWVLVGDAQKRTWLLRYALQ